MEDHPFSGKVGDRITHRRCRLWRRGCRSARRLCGLHAFVITEETVLAEIEEIHRQYAPHAGRNHRSGFFSCRTPVSNIRFAVAASISTWLTTSSWSSSTNRSAICSSAWRPAPDRVRPVVACPPYAYRNRIMVRTQFNRETRSMNVGYLRHQSRLVVDVESCPILSRNSTNACRMFTKDPREKMVSSLPCEPCRRLDSTSRFLFR